MAEMTPERLAEIRERAAKLATYGGYHNAALHLMRDDVPALCDALAEVTRQRDAARATRDEALKGVEAWAASSRHYELDADKHRTRADAAERAHDDLLHACGVMRSEVEQIETDARAERAEIETRVYQAFADADLKGLDLNALTVHGLTHMVMTAIRQTGDQR